MGGLSRLPPTQRNIATGPSQNQVVHSLQTTAMSTLIAVRPLIQPATGGWSRSARSNESLATRMLSQLFWLVFLVPNPAGTVFMNQYAYALVAFLGWMLLRIRMRMRTRDRWHPLCWIAALSAAAAVYAYLPSLLATPNTTLLDVFQIARELYPFGVLFGAGMAWSQVRISTGRVFIRRLVACYLVLTVAALLLQMQSVTFREILFKYYYSHGDEDFYRGHMERRPTLTAGNPNCLAYMTVCVTVCGVAMRTVSTARALGLLALASVAIIWTWSRTGIIVWLAGLQCVLLLHRRDLAIYSLIAVIIVAGTVIIVQPTAVMELIVSFHDRYFEQHASMSARQENWISLLNSPEFRNNWLIGAGPSTSSLRVVDSWYVLILYRYGALGLTVTLLYLSAMVIFMMRRLSDYRQRDAAVMGLALVVVFLVGSIPMAPSVTPRLCTVFFALLGAVCMRPDPPATSGVRT